MNYLGDEHQARLRQVQEDDEKMNAAMEKVENEMIQKRELQTEKKKQMMKVYTYELSDYLKPIFYLNDTFAAKFRNLEKTN